MPDVDAAMFHHAAPANGFLSRKLAKIAIYSDKLKGNRIMVMVESYKEFILKVENEIAYLTINRPSMRNSLNETCFAELNLFLDFIEENPKIKIAIITGTGDKAFIAGADIDGVRNKSGIAHLKNPVLENIYQKLENCTKPILAAINGLAFGGGFELAMACDIRIASENAKFGLPETSLGIHPGAGGTQRLSRLAGVGVAKEVIMAGRIITADEAKNLGLVMRVVPLASLMEETVSVAKKMLEKGPLALLLAKKAINASLSTDLSTGLLIETLGYAMLMDSGDKQEGIQSFLEKRPPNFKGEQKGSEECMK